MLYCKFVMANFSSDPEDFICCYLHQAVLSSGSGVFVGRLVVLFDR